ncbi:hypothetical protein ES708_05737 [subsurface metagenome]
MAFEWAEDISKDAKIHAADLLEIRTNIDTVDDEKCAAHKVSYCSNQKIGDDTSYNPGYYSGHKRTVQSSYCPGYCPANNYSVYPTFQGVYVP